MKSVKSVIPPRIKNRKSLEVVLLAPPESSSATLYGMYDIFCAAGRDWQLLTQGTPGESLILPKIVSRDGQGFNTGNGAWIQPQGSLGTCREPDVICIPDLLVAPGENIHGRHPAEMQWLREQFARGVTIATACSGVLLLAEAGLLNGCEATIHWAFAEGMRKQYPRISVRADRSVVIDGEEQRILMAGGGVAWTDLALLIVARFFGSEEAVRLARIFMLDWHHVGQQPYAVLARPKHATDALIAQCQQWLAHHYENDAPVAKMAALIGLSDRTFARRFAKATGMSPLEYVHTLRLEEAKQMLEGSDEPVEEIANQVGYEDTSFFGRLFRRKVGLTPTQYRKRFGSLRRMLNHNTKQ
jgi:transcriptional regulator GlxA family with amidase domain